ncbi:group II truncated hemoglobin [Algicola sagamiensis]|uniref:group II truncated hemoglobin n=1 Tax=Algicola sagamiensis TaxID=163869 RepID=UPI00036D7A44|nr:group II truncated hemoglobin [Algicola sagamiensis]
MQWLSSVFKRRNASEQKEAPTPERTPYQMIGEAKGTRNLANRFYDIMETDDAVKELLQLHPMPLDRIREKFYEFLSGWLGGPSLFEEKYGHPRLRMRHMPFSIDEKMRDQWMYCMTRALELEVDNPLLREGLKESFYQLATHMINREVCSIREPKAP